MAALAGCDPSEVTVLLIEPVEELRRLPFHTQRCAFTFSTMRHFAGEVEAAGYAVDYKRCAEDAGGAIRRHRNMCRNDRLRLMASAEWGVDAWYEALATQAGYEVEVVANNQFLSDTGWFAEHAAGRKSLLMESFYREMRKTTGLLMDAGKPVGGAWNFDKENRKPPGKGMDLPPIPRYEPDAVTREALDDVTRLFPDHFGSQEDFAWPVTRKDAEAFAEDFMQHRLADFGPYQDAMVTGQDYLFHSLLSPLINCGLLAPMPLCEAAEERYREGWAPLSSVEGFIRQIIGWREYVYQVYRLKMPGYREENFFGADLALPDVYWTGETEMRCMAEALRPVLAQGINHHIQRLMITGNFALVAGVNPQAVNDWYWLAYMDAYDWVVTPNVVGMALHADGGLLGTKPYAASANYINKMSDYCKHCPYDAKARTGEKACPFNALYWDFLARNERKLKGNPRMTLVYKAMDRLGGETLKDIREHAKGLRDRLRAGESL